MARIGSQFPGRMAWLAAAGALLAQVCPAQAGLPSPVQTIAQASAGKKPARGKAAPPRPSAAPQPSELGDLSRWCKAIAQRLIRLPLETCLSSQLQAGEGRSVRGIPLWFRDILPPDEGPVGLRALVIGGIHGDEKASVNLVFDWLARAGATQAHAIHWRFVPLANPDGLLRPNATRTNARGVDLNRNFPTADWERDAHTYWVRRTGKDPRRYPGPHAMSEPETRWLQNQIEQFQPQLIVSIHAPYGLLDFDGPPPPPPKLGSLFLDRVGVYPGSLGNFGGVMQGVPVLTVELKNALQVSRAETQAIWVDLLRWMDQRLPSDKAAALDSDASGAEPTR